MIIFPIYAPESLSNSLSPPQHFFLGGGEGGLDLLICLSHSLLLILDNGKFAGTLLTTFSFKNTNVLK